MFEYVSKAYQPNGPSIEVIFYLSEGKIFDIRINAAKKKESSMVWEIQADKEYPKIEKEISRWMEAYCSKKESSVQLPLDLSNMPPYCLLVLKQVSKIASGSTLSYKEVAEKTGKPKAARAVGNACGRNPFPLVIPCHRVLGSGGQLGGYSGGLEVKKRLLAFETSL
jgi:methylated-DNA-[protein]-cysteine S-methyltransferase